MSKFSSYKEVLDSITDKIGKLNLAEAKYVVRSISEMDMNLLKGQPEQRIIIVLSRVFAEKIKSNREELAKKAKPTSIGLNDYLQNIQDTDGDNPVNRLYNRPDADETVVQDSDSKSGVNCASLFSLDKLSDIRNIFNPSANWERNYIVLDSRYRSTATDGTRKIQWQYAIGNAVRKGSVNSTNPIKNIVSMKLYQPILPLVSGMVRNTGRISLLIEEFSSQAFIASETRKYHYLMRLALPFDTEQFVECQIDGYGDGVFQFKDPIKTFETLTISFGDPLNELVFSADRSNADIATTGTSTNITTNTAHGLTVDTVVYIENFTTSNPTADYLLINRVNNSLGITAVVVDTVTLTLSVDTSTIVGTPATFEVFYGNRRIILAFEMTSLITE